jgi:hypothetical protein
MMTPNPQTPSQRLRDIHARSTVSNAAEIALGYPTDDHEAQGLGWPCVGAWRAMAARVVVAALPVRLVPRGSSLATAAAIEAHQP